MSTGNRVYLLGGAQTDFSRNWAREGLDLFDMFREVTLEGLQQTALDPSDIEVGHIGNFVAELFAGQGQLGGFFGHVDPAMAGMPACRHEAACASGSMALLADGLHMASHTVALGIAAFDGPNAAIRRGARRLFEVSAGLDFEAPRTNAFAILGLRALYFLLADARERFHYLSHGLGAILIFVGFKMILGRWYHIDTFVSLGIITLILVVAIIFSERKARQLGITRPNLAQALQASYDGYRTGVYREADELLHRPLARRVAAPAEHGQQCGEDEPAERGPH